MFRLLMSAKEPWKAGLLSKHLPSQRRTVLVSSHKERSQVYRDRRLSRLAREEGAERHFRFRETDDGDEMTATPLATTPSPVAGAVAGAAACAGCCAWCCCCRAATKA